MADMAIGAAIQGLKTAGEMAGGFIKLRDEALVQGKVIELQAVILAAQSSALAAQGEQFALLNEKRDMEERIAQLEAWKSEKDRYVLKEVAPGSFAYALKPEAENGEPPHILCGDCFQQGVKSFLQATNNRGLRGYRLYRCQRCGSSPAVDPRTYSRNPEPGPPSRGLMDIPDFSAV